MSLIGSILYNLIYLAIIFVIARFVVDWVQLLARQWQPRGAIAVLCEAIFTVTDPPLRALRKVIPPIRLGGIMLDVSAMVLLLLLFIAQSLVLVIF
ncbi:YggT family protein [Aeromicrobium sp. 636]|uniref:YggT family protein n=1 Tax=Aeromicrobium senzhongii TaxID=2663859 RepID=A0A8I0ES53_9ACTN|nr:MULTISPECIES: YggT family protein [Aeromicrobium]MBC9225436.1 YggT family protein [Aeromicrobium senzhongii]MCQ3997546.1 YggT family protein [Aeromicrobium sp. 636]MTB87472.1 YggT family protein [Aeromicrobium senzhongii]QNL95477.1 YggT family protein [Aeromicrobium senzhongii]